MKEYIAHMKQSVNDILQLKCLHYYPPVFAAMSRIELETDSFSKEDNTYLNSFQNTPEMRTHSF